MPATLPAPQKAPFEMDFKGINCKETKELRVILEEMLEEAKLKEGYYTAVVNGRVPTSANSGPNVGIRNALPNGVKVMVKYSTGNDSRYECMLSKAGMKTDKLRQALIDGLKSDYFEPAGKKSGTLVPFPSAAAESASQKQEADDAAPTEDRDESPSLKGFTNEDTGVALMILELWQKHGDNGFTSEEFRSLMRSQKLCREDASNKSIGRILSWFIQHEHIVRLDESLGGCRYKVSEKGKRVLEVHQSLPKPPEPPSPVALKISARIAKLESLSKEFSDAKEIEKTVSSEITERSRKLDEVQIQIRSLEEQKGLLEADLAELEQRKRNIAAIVNDPERESAARKLAAIQEALE